MNRLWVSFAAALPLALALALAGGAAVPSAGQEAGPATPPAADGPAETGPSACLVEPRPIAEVVTLVGTAIPGGPQVSPATPPPVSPPGGAPADPATAAAVEATLRELVACLELGEFGRAYALYTDGFLRRTVGPLDEDQLALLEGIGFPKAGERTPPALEILEVRQPETGRVSVLARVAAADAGTPRLRAFALVQEGGRWRIDGAADVAGVGTPSP